MAMLINNNAMALNAQRNLGITNRLMGRALERLSSGMRINRAADDAAGLAISEKMRSQIRGMQQGLRNAQDGVSMIQTAEGALSETHAILQRMRELAVQAGSTTLSSSDREAIGDELLTLRTEIDNIATRTRFNGLNLLTGALTSSLTTGAADIDGQTFNDGINGDVVTVSLAAGTALEAGQTYTVSADTVGNTITLTDTAANVSQTLSLTGTTAGTTTFDFTLFDIQVTATVTGTTGDGSTADGEMTIAQLASGFDGLEGGNDSVYSTGQGNATFRVGSEIGDDITVAFSDVRAAAIGSGGANDIADLVNDNQAVSTTTKADTLLTSIDAALGQVSTQRAKLGAAQNQTESAINSLGVSVENLSASESRIRDADVAAVSSELVTRQIMQQAGVAVLAQANAASQSVLSLLG